MTAIKTDHPALIVPDEAPFQAAPSGAVAAIADAADPPVSDVRRSTVLRTAIPYDVVKQRLFRLVRAN